MDTLPQELLEKIFYQLNYSNCCSLTITNSFHYRILTSGQIWREKLLRDFQLADNEYLNLEYKDIYKFIYTLDNGNLPSRIFSRAICTGHLNTIKFLFSTHQLTNIDYEQALSKAVIYNQLEIVEFFIHQGRFIIDSFTERTYMGKTGKLIYLPHILIPCNHIYQLAALSNNREIIKLLLRDKSISIPPSISPLVIACYFGYSGIVRMLISDRRVDPTYNDNWPLTIATMKDNFKIVKILIDDGRIFTKNIKNYILQKIADSQNLEILFSLLISKNKCQKMLIYSCKHGYMEIVKLLLNDPRTNPAGRNNRALRIATKYQWTNIIKLFTNDQHYY